MHRIRMFAACAALSVGACASEPEAVSQSWRNGRDGLCLTGVEGSLRAGLVAYGQGESNCSLSGPATKNGDMLTITPNGDSRCRIEVGLAGQKAQIGRLASSCAYYCGPGADYAGRVLQLSTGPATGITDLAGDPLC